LPAVPSVWVLAVARATRGGGAGCGARAEQSSHRRGKHHVDE